jgi:Domain of unknown function (DUF4386)
MEHDMTTDTYTANTTSAVGRPAPRRRMDPMRKISLAGGVLYLITFAASIPALKLYADVLNHADYITTPGSNTPLLWGAWLEVITGVAGVGTALALYPVTKRVSPTAALGFVTSRVVECALIIVGVVSLLAVVTLRHDLAGASGADATSLVTTGRALVSVHNWTFLLGPGTMAGINGIFLASIMYRSRLVPRIIPTLGLIGAPLILASATGTLFGGWDQVSSTGVVLGAPIALWEFSLGVWLTFKGFKPAAVAALPVG